MHTLDADDPAVMGCGLSTPKENCCSPHNQCGENEGVCKWDIDCKEDLVCGKNKCPSDSKLDCCVPISPLLKGSSRDCSLKYNKGKDVSGNWGCCTADSPCDQWQGDCDDNGDCKEGLVCGANNCPTGYGTSIEYDCCQISKYGISYLLVMLRASG